MSETENTINELALGIGARAKNAGRALSLCTKEARDDALNAMAQNIRADSANILAQNQIDYDAAQKSGLSAALLDRLMLNPARVEAMAQGLEAIATQSDCINEVIEEWQRPNGLKMQKVRIPIGTIGIIYESRPNVTADAGGLCVRSGNSVVLRGGSDAFLTSTAIANCLRRGLKTAGLPEDVIQFIPSKDRAMVGEMLKGMGGAIDMIVPRGGKTLVARVNDEAKVPVLSHLEGICHTYIHQDADFNKALAIVVNAKMRRTGVCGATETVLIDAKIAYEILPIIANELIRLGCELRGDEKANAIFPMVIANELDWHTEYLAPILAIRIIANIDEAIAHIGEYGSGHTDAIITENDEAANKFLSEVDSAIVIHNSSTQFADGGEFGFGGEIGIGTGRLHARGPVGALGLTTYKYLVRGAGQIRAG